MSQEAKRNITLLIPFALFVNFAIVIKIVEIEFFNHYDKTIPLPGLAELYLNTPFFIWIFIGAGISFTKNYLNENNYSKIWNFAWWSVVLISPFLMALGLLCPFSHDLSHYFTGSCNWQFY